MPVKNLLTPKTEAILNKAIFNELYASNLYKHVANHCQRLGFFGAQKFFEHESSEELKHYQMLTSYINDRGSVAQVPMIDAMDESIASLLDALETAYDTETYFGELYEGWYRDCDCITTQQFLLQFIEIQRKAVGEISDLLARLNLCGNDKAALLILDKELGA